MNRTMNQRSEEARRLAAAALDQARERQREAVAERARVFDFAAEKVRELRAKRIARASEA